jgi:UDP-N-acetylmuramate dehydrogenase
VTIQEYVELAPYTTLGVGGAARWFAETRSDDEILAVLQFARERRVPCFFLGGGSNLLVSDDGYAGVVLRIAATETHWSEEEDGRVSLSADAGADWDSLVTLAVEHNAAGIECLAGIPGSAGGTPVQNVGAYGQEISSSIERVHAIDVESGEAVVLAAAECGFGYRRSFFNTTLRGRYVITRVVYSLQVDGPPRLEYRDVKQYFAERGVATPSLAETADAVRHIRARKGMLLSADDPDSRSAGSFFKNPIVPEETVRRMATLSGRRMEEIPQFPSGVPGAGTVKLSAAWLMELAGFHRGFSIGRAGLSTKHVLAIVNRGGATAAEILALRDAVITGVQERTGILLEQEPVMLGF